MFSLLTKMRWRGTIVGAGYPGLTKAKATPGSTVRGSGCSAALD